jgi:large repetitive protein
MNSTICYRLGALLLAAAAVTGCTLDKQAAPSLTGPSEYGLSVTMTASPDQLPRDGSAQSMITLTARDENGKPVSGQRFTLGVNGASGVGLSQTEVTTGSDGRATFVVSAPPSTALAGGSFTVFATPVGSNFDNAVPRSLTIALLGTPNATEPTAAFTVTPATPEVGQLATFDASTSTDEGRACGTACTYAWTFDDGGTATGRQVTHTFAAANTYNVALTVTDASGLTATTRQLVTVTAPVVTATVIYSPNDPKAGDRILFSAVNPSAPNGATIVSYEWDFGDPFAANESNGAIGITVDHRFTVARTYLVRLTVTDSQGRVGVITTNVTITTAGT